MVLNTIQCVKQIKSSHFKWMWSFLTLQGIVLCAQYRSYIYTDSHWSNTKYHIDYFSIYIYLYVNITKLFLKLAMTIMKRTCYALKLCDTWLLPCTVWHCWNQFGPCVVTDFLFIIMAGNRLSESQKWQMIGMKEDRCLILSGGLM